MCESTISSCFVSNLEPDLQKLITYLCVYIFPPNDTSIHQHTLRTAKVLSQYPSVGATMFVKLQEVLRDACKVSITLEYYAHSTKKHETSSSIISGSSIYVLYQHTVPNVACRYYPSMI